MMEPERDKSLSNDVNHPARGVLNFPDPVSKEEDRAIQAPRIPTIFFVPSPSGENGSERIRDLSQFFNCSGLCTFRFSDNGRSVGTAELLDLYSECINNPRVAAEQVILLGLSEGADQIAQLYYRFLEVQTPLAVLMLSPTVGPFELNRLTCPYLILHGQGDLQFAGKSDGNFENAVHHHQMRYGDTTTALRFQGLGKELGDEKIDLRVKDQITNWLANGTLRKTA